MSRWRLDRASAPRLLAVDRTQLVWMKKHGEGLAPMAGWAYGGATAANVAQDELAHFKPGVIDVIACSDVAQHWVQMPPAAVASLSELRRVAQARCAHLHGGSPEGWSVTGDWNASRSFVCMGLPHEIVHPVEEKLAEHGLVPRWRSAWSMVSCALARSFSPDGWSALRTPVRVILWHCRDSLVDCMASWAVSR